MYIEMLENPAHGPPRPRQDETTYEPEFYQEDDDLADWEPGYQYKDTEYISPMVELWLMMTTQYP